MPADGIPTVRVLLCAYACDPDHGGEPGSGWHWAAALRDAGCEVVVLVPEHKRDTIEHRLDREPIDGLRFEFVPEPRVPLPLPRSSLRGQVRYVLWQVSALRRARAVVAGTSVDVVHHVTYGSLQGGSFLGRLDVPFVFGPVGGGQTAERELARWFGRSWRNERLRTSVTRIAGLLPMARSAVRRAAAVVVVNEDTADLARRIGAREVLPMLDVGLPPEFFPDDIRSGTPRSDSSPFRILWLGRVLPRKGLDLAIRAFDRADLADAELVVVGDGPRREDAERLAGTLGRAAEIRFTGYVPHAEIAEHLRAADLFLFTSLRDSGGSQLLEAAAFGLPLVVLDHHGAGELPDDMARKVAIAPPDALVDSLATTLRELAAAPETRADMGEAARRFALAHTWAEHARQMMGIYELAIGRAQTERAP